ncbi:DUF4435 domain-containing protein [Agrobacterium vitis]|uniref:DUF4435 domain-containing protein n=1 Tax=Agrobacterium vitis TaxID=373 RepID=UPI0015DA100A|nr:DUF4435 domain-containing protein [Agrobacterium vitis]MCF1451366.1 DUF4435 domain-containing protein [Agrobacterium vitis]
MFLRTDSGITNRALFTDANFTLYVEGGGGVDGAGSSDVVFWGDVFRHLRPDLKVTIIAHGGKPELEFLADKILSGDIDNTLVALDSDFDELLNHRKDHSNIIYTYGYSWENDVFCPEQISQAVKRLLKVDVVDNQKCDIVVSVFNDLLRKLTPWINADFWLRSMNSSLFPKISSGRFLANIPGTFEVELDAKVISSAFKIQMNLIKIENRKNRPGLWILSSQCFLHGHTIKFLMKCVLNFAMRLFGKKQTVSDDFLEHLMVYAFCQNVNTDNSHRNVHYRDALSRIAPS